MSDFAMPQGQILLFSDAEMKICKGCEEPYPIEDFRLQVRRDGRTVRSPYCDECRKQNSRDYYSEKVAADPSYANVQSRKSTLAKYGLTPEDYQVMFNTQKGLCAICGRAPEGNGVSRHNLVVDNDHDTGQVRSLLCDFCNRGLGIFRDDPDLLDKAAEYLRTYRGIR